MRKVFTGSWIFLLGLIANASNRSMDIGVFQAASSANVSFHSSEGTSTCMMMPETRMNSAIETMRLRLDYAATEQERKVIRERLEQILNEAESLAFSQ